MQKIKVEVRIDSMGSLVAIPVSRAHQLKYKRHLEEWNVFTTDAALYIQSEDAVQSFLGSFVPKRKRSRLRCGFTEVVLIDPHYYGMMLGHDAQHVEL